MFTVNGKELDYDIFDADKADVYEKAMNTVSEKMATLEKEKDSMSFAKAIRAQCETVAECFDTLFGGGAAAGIFDGTLNLKLALQSFQELVDGINEKKKEIEQMAKAAKAKYGGNRAARRAK